jgi:hypothetical protein
LRAFLFAVPLYSFFHPDLSSRILHPIYTLPARTLNICVLVPNVYFYTLIYSFEFVRFS